MRLLASTLIVAALGGCTQGLAERMVAPPNLRGQPVPGMFLSDGDYVEIVTAAGKIAGFDPDAARPLAAIGRTRARVRGFSVGWFGR